MYIIATTCIVLIQILLLKLLVLFLGANNYYPLFLLSFDELITIKTVCTTHTDTVTVVSIYFRPFSRLTVLLLDLLLLRC